MASEDDDFLEVSSLSAPGQLDLCGKNPHRQHFYIVSATTLVRNFSSCSCFFSEEIQF